MTYMPIANLNCNITVYDCLNEILDCHRFLNSGTTGSW
jgi:hypothetical protein